jgi:hypothetical protein
MLRSLLMGTAAGACGTVALNLVTYLDMAIRGRPASQVPAQVAEKVAAGVGLDFETSRPPMASDQQQKEQEQQAESRKSGSGALLGYVVGLGIGSAYGVVRPFLGNLPAPLAGAMLGVLAMASSDAPAIGLGVTDPREWGASGWLADLLPHVAYGLVTAVAFDAFTGGALGRRSTPTYEKLLLGAGHSARRLSR